MQYVGLLQIGTASWSLEISAELISLRNA